MAHYAKVNNGKVEQVIVAEVEFFNTFVDSSPGTWLQTSYNTRGGIHYEPNSNNPSSDQSKALRKNYAGIGYSYDQARDAFIPPKPFNSWILNENTCGWEAPVAMPELTQEQIDNKNYYAWNESIINWELKNNE
jgi:hypothetical protein